MCAQKPLRSSPSRDNSLNIDYAGMSNEQVVEVFERHLQGEIEYLNLDRYSVEKIKGKFQTMIRIETREDAGFQAWQWIDKKSPLYKNLRPVEEFTRKLLMKRSGQNLDMEAAYEFFQSFVQEVEFQRSNVDRAGIVELSDPFPEVDEEELLKIADATTADVTVVESVPIEKQPCDEKEGSDTCDGKEGSDNIPSFGSDTIFVVLESDIVEAEKKAEASSQLSSDGSPDHDRLVIAILRWVVW